MFIILISYKKPLEIIDQHLAAHRAYLDLGYAENLLVASGPRNPRTGGVIVSQLKNREQLESYLNNDPFRIHEVADYEIIEFTPVKYHADFVNFVA